MWVPDDGGNCGDDGADYDCDDNYDDGCDDM